MRGPPIKLQPASFRGASFGVTSDSLDTGRRTVKHEFPGREKPYVEDLGRKTRSFSIEGFVVGKDYADRRNELLSALEQSGTGVLIHPYYGEMTVQVDNVSVSHSAQDGGMAIFSITFTEPGDVAFSFAYKDLASALGLAADNVVLEAAVAYERVFATDPHNHG